MKNFLFLKGISFLRCEILPLIARENLMEKPFCKECTKRGVCRVICPELESHLHKDIEAGMREQPVGLAFDSVKSMPEIIQITKLSKMQAEVVALLLRGFPPTRIMHKLKLSRGAFDMHMLRIRAIVKGLDNSSVEENQGGTDPIPPSKREEIS